MTAQGALWTQVPAPRGLAQPGGKFDQWLTPEWAAALLVERHFADLTTTDFVVEPAAGRGSWLKALPAEVPAIGVEIDPQMAQVCRAETGREVIVGDFREVELPADPTVILGNPPFVAEVVDGFLDRALALLPESGRCGLLLPAYTFQTPSRVSRWAGRWSIAVELIPRTLFMRSRLPLVFALFRKEQVRRLFGLALYAEAEAFARLPDPAQLVLTHGRPRMGVWRALVVDVLERLGGTAALPDIYTQIEGRRPTPNAFWREKIRQTVQLHCQRVGPGVWSLEAP